jgi:hypothetical protein
MIAMNREIAERLAATSVDDVSTETARQIIAEFLRVVGTCSVCGGTGIFVSPRNAEVFVTFNQDGDRFERAMLHAGPHDCPQCHGTAGTNGGDPEYVFWYCTVQYPQCGPGQRKDGPEHARCGYRVMLPFEPGRA